MIRPAAAQVVGRHAPIVVVACFFDSLVGSLVNPVLDGTFRPFNQGVVVPKIGLLDVAIDRRLDLNREPRFTLLAAVVSLPFVTSSS